jgi:hypothetical protein
MKVVGNACHQSLHLDSLLVGKSKENEVLIISTGNESPVGNAAIVAAIEDAIDFVVDPNPPLVMAHFDPVLYETLV